MGASRSPGLGRVLLAGWILAAPAAARGESLDRFLLEAARTGDADGVGKALALGANANYVEPVPAHGGGDTPLYVAVTAKSREAVRLLLAHGADPLVRPPGGPPGSGPWNEAPLWKFPLAWSRNADAGIFDLLLASLERLPPADDRLVDFVVRPAARAGAADILRAFEAKGVRLSAVSASGNTLVTGFAEAGRFGDAAAGLERHRESYRAEPNRSVRVDEALEYAVAHPHDDEALAAFVEDARRAGLAPLPNDRWGEPVWKRAAAYRLPATARVLGCPPEELVKIVPRSAEELVLAAACTPETHDLFVASATKLLGESQDPRGAASRLLGALTGNVLLRPTVSAVDFLIAHGADLNAAFPRRQGLPLTPLQALVSRDAMDLAQVLVDRGAEVNRLNADSGLTVLDVAVGTGKLRTVRWALEHGALVQERRSGRPLLRVALAVAERSPEGDDIAAELLARGADPYLKGGDGKSAVDLLAERRDLVRLRRLDARGERRSLLDEYAPAPGSPFVGVWSNGKDGFETFTLILTPDGMAWLGTSVEASGFHPWRATGADTAVVEATLNQQRKDFPLQWVAAEGQLRLTGPTGPAGVVLRRGPERALPAEDWLKAWRERGEAPREPLRDPVGEPDWDPTTKNLFLSGRRLTALDPRIEAMRGLRTLAAPDNRLRELPGWLAGMKELTTLGLAENWLSALPPWFGGLVSLESLSLRMNAFRALPAELRPLKSLADLDLSHNQISSLHAWWGEFPALRQLSLEGNRLSSLPGGCSGLRSLGTLRLANNALTTLPECLLQLPKLRTVYLTGNPISPAEQERLKRRAPGIRWVF